MRSALSGEMRALGIVGQLLEKLIKIKIKYELVGIHIMINIFLKLTFNKFCSFFGGNLHENIHFV